MIIIRDIEQGTKEWQDLRRGKITGTKLCDVMGTKAAYESLVAELIAEEGTEQIKVTRSTAAMERGTAEEVFARKAYADKFGVRVEQVTMLFSEKYPWLGVSPDGMVKDKKTKKYTGQIEIKNPESSTMISYRMGNDLCELGIPKAYKWQVVQSFLVNKDLEWLDFVVYDARFIEDEHKMWVVRITDDNEALIEAMALAMGRLLPFRDYWNETRERVLPSNF